MIMETESTTLFSISSSSSLLKMNSSSDSAPIILREYGNMMSSPETTVFGWGDFPVLNEYTAGHTFTSCSPSSRFDTSSYMQQEWSSTPPSYVVASSSMRRRQYHFDDDDDTPSTPSLALSLVSSSDDDDDDDDDTASNYSDESEIASSAFQQRKQQALVSQPVSKTSIKQQQHVHFATVTVQEHEVVLGDHPWAGPYPLALGWQRYATHEYTLDDYEHERMSGRRRSRCRGELPRRLSAVERCQRLLDTTATEPSLALLQQLEKKRQHELENQTYPMHDDDNDENDESPLCFQDKIRQLPADFYTTIVSSRKKYGTIHFF